MKKKPNWKLDREDLQGDMVKHKSPILCLVREPNEDQI